MSESMASAAVQRRSIHPGGPHTRATRSRAVSAKPMWWGQCTIATMVAIVITAATTPPVPAAAQQTEATDALPPVPSIQGVHWVGHAQLDHVRPLTDGRWLSLGDDGLTILWDEELRPVSWIRTEGDRVLDVLADGAFVGSGSQSQRVRVAADGTMTAESPVTHAAVVACESGGWWAWSEDESTLVFHRGDAAPHTWAVQTGAAPEARCVTTPEHAALYWPDGDRVRIVSTSHPIVEPTWQLALAVLRPVSMTDFVLTGLSDEGLLQGVRVSDGSALSDAHVAVIGGFRLGSCGAFDDDLHEGCLSAPGEVSQAMMVPRQIVPFEVVITGSWLTVVGSGAAMRLAWQQVESDTDTGANDVPQSEGLLVIYDVTSSPGGSADDTGTVTWTACRRTPTGLEVVQVEGQNENLDVRAQSVDACPSGWWSADATAEDGLIYNRDESSTAEARSPVLGRNGLHFLATPRWEPSCGTPAWTVYRATSELEPTPISEPACGRSVRFLPLWSPAQQVLGTVALLERESGQWVAQSYNFVGDALVRATFRDDVELTTRFVMVDDAMCTLAPHRRTARCLEDGRWRTREWETLGSEPAFTVSDFGVHMGVPVDSTLLGGPSAWVLWSPTRMVTSEAAESRLVVEWSDGVLLRGDDPRMQERLLALQAGAASARPGPLRSRLRVSESGDDPP